MRSALEVADIFRRHGGAYRADQLGSMTLGQRRVMAAIEACRTAALGGHVERCEDCGETRISYNSCRNRHCPKCQGLARAQWIADRQAELLPVTYFHVVFTVPEAIAGIALQNKAVDPQHLGAAIGVTAVLHTWGQNLFHHPHIHCIVPGGGVSADGRWIACRPGFFLSVRVLSRLYRRLFLERLQAAFNVGMLNFFGELAGLAKPAAFATHLRPLRGVEWVVYAKRPFGGPQQVLEYLGRYTHRVAIANNRLIALADGQVRFRWRDYRHPQRPKIMTLPVGEFIRRFLLHVLPNGFRRIRHFGFLANTHRRTKLALIRGLLDLPEPETAPEPADYRERYARLFGRPLDICRACGGHLVDIAVLNRAAKPAPFSYDSS